MNYFLDGRINRAEILFPGVGCFLVAVGLGSLLHNSNTADTKRKMELAHKESAVTEMHPFGSDDVEKCVNLPDAKASNGLFVVNLHEIAQKSGTSLEFLPAVCNAFSGGVCSETVEKLKTIDKPAQISDFSL